jgi:hypothetical protein
MFPITICSYSLYSIDTQGLLDRVFPLPDSDTISSSKASTSKDVIKTYSLRALLKDSSMHPFHVLRVSWLCLRFMSLSNQTLVCHSTIVSYLVTSTISSICPGSPTVTLLQSRTVSPGPIILPEPSCTVALPVNPFP